jgi:hypothetical protein
MKRVLLTLLLPVIVTVVSAQNRPLITEPVELVEKGYVRTELGVEFLQKAVFPLSGLEGDLSRLGVIGLRLGAGDHVEVQLFWTARNYLSIENRIDAPFSGILNCDGNSTSDFGDVQLATKIRFKQEMDAWPGIGFRFGVKLPNASNESGLGADTTDFTASFLFEKHLGDLRVFGNAGLAILGDPLKAASQDDLFGYGLALLYPVTERINALVDWHGRAGPGGIGTEEQSLLRFGAQIEAAGLHWDVGGLVGFLDTDPSTGVLFGVTKDFRTPFF